MMMKKVLACFAAAVMLVSVTACNKDEQNSTGGDESSWSDTLPNDYVFKWGESYYGINKSERKTLAIEDNGACTYKADGEDKVQFYLNNETKKFLDWNTDEEVATCRIVSGKVEFTIGESTVTLDKVTQDTYTAYVQLLSASEQDPSVALPGEGDGDGNYQQHGSDPDSSSQATTEPVTTEPVIATDANVEDLSESYLQDVASQSYEMKDDDIHLTVYAEGGVVMVSVETENIDGYELLYFNSFDRGLETAIDDGYMFKGELRAASDNNTKVNVFWSVPTGTGKGKIKLTQGYKNEFPVERDDLLVIG